MDLISQIVATRDSVEAEQVRDDLEKLSSSTESLTRKMKSELNNKNNLSLRVIFTKKTNFSSEISSLSASAMGLEKHIKELNPGVGSFIESSSSCMLERIQQITVTLLFLQMIDEAESLRLELEETIQNDIHTAAIQVMKLKSIYNHIKQSEFSVFSSHYLLSYCTKYATLKIKAMKEWNQFIEFKFNQLNKTTISSHFSVNSVREKLKNTCKTLHILQVSFKDEFRHNFLNYIFKPILNHKHSLKIQQTENCKWILTINYLKDSKKMPLENVIDNLIQVFTLLNSHLDFEETEVSFLQSIGLLCANEVIDLFIQNHLAMNELEDIEKTIDLIDKLLRLMREKGFLIKDNKLSEYAEQLVSQYEDRILSQNISNAMLLLKTDILNKMLVGPISLSLPMPDITLFHSGYTCVDITLDSDVNTQERKMIFPECSISKMMFELVKLIRTILADATSYETSLKINVYKAVTQIIDNYLIFVEDLCRHSVPLNAALSFNNSMYLIMELMHTDDDYHVCSPIHGLINKLQDLAFSVMDECILSQQKMINQLLHRSDLDKANKCNELPENIETVIKECLQQLTLLQNDWINTLPMDVYCDAMGHLCCAFIDEILSLTMSTNHKAYLSTQLLRSILIVSNKIPLLFKDKVHVEKYVKNWSRLNEFCNTGEITFFGTAKD